MYLLDHSAVMKDIKEHKEWECYYKGNMLSLELGEEISVESLKPKDENVKKDLYSEHCQILMKEIQDDTDGETYHILGLEESILRKWLC